MTEDRRLRVLVFYDAKSTYTATTIEYLRSFSTFSKHEIYYACGVRNTRFNVDLDAFDVVILHYSVRLSLERYISKDCARAVESFPGLKILIIQDEYESTENTRRWMERLRFDVVFNTVPPEYRAVIYPPERFPNVDFITFLTGFVPARLELDIPRRPIASRRLKIVYRGNDLPYWYGSLGQEKQIIGRRMKSICLERNIPADIEWDSKHRIYGDAWYDFLESGKATLGTESGSNLFDEDGSIKRAIEADLRVDPSLTFEEASRRYFAHLDGRVRMNQISPRIFEAIGVRTALILFEGEYSGIVRPWEHYIPLKKDFSNLDQVLEKLDDDAFLEAMTNRAHDDIIGSRKYGYGAAIAAIDEVIAKRATKRHARQLFSLVFATEGADLAHADLDRVRTWEDHFEDFVTTAPLTPEEAALTVRQMRSPEREVVRAAWEALPRRARIALRPVVRWVRSLRRRPMVE